MYHVIFHFEFLNKICVFLFLCLKKVICLLKGTQFKENMNDHPIYFKDTTSFAYSIFFIFTWYNSKSWLSVSHQRASPMWASCLSWCHRSNPRRRRKRTCSGGLSLCGNLPGASVGRWWAPRPCGPSFSPSQSTCQPAGNTWCSPWCVLTDYTGIHRFSAH